MKTGLSSLTGGKISTFFPSRWPLIFLSALAGSLALAAGAFAQVQSVSDVTFAVPTGWAYQQGADFGAMAQKQDTRRWVIAVYSAMPSSGDSKADFRAAWKRIALAGADYRDYPYYGPYEISLTVGYPGMYNEDSSVNKTSYTRVYVLETGNTFVPVAFVSQNREVLDGMDYMARAAVGNVRVAPLRASPIQMSIKQADLAGNWTNGIVNSIDFYSSAGQYQSDSLTAVKYSYTIAFDGNFTYKLNGWLNNRTTSDTDFGVVELGGEFVTLKGQKHVRRYRFVNLQQTLDGSTVLTLWPPVEMSKIDPRHDSEFLTRPTKR